MKENIVDKIVSFISPERGLQRLRAKFTAEQFRKYDAGAHDGRRTKKWWASGSSANTEIAAYGKTLRNRSRDLVRNNSYAGKAVKGIAANVAGSGIMPSIRHNDPQTEEKAKQIWNKWADSAGNIDFDGDLNFYGMQFLDMRTIAESGGILVRRVRGMKGDVPFQVQLLEPDHLDDSRDGEILNGGNEIRMGIEFNKKGKRVAYWLLDDHPGENKVWRSLQSVRVPAEDIIHIFLKERPGQIRGVPFGVGSFIKMKDFDEYEDAQLIRQKIAACFAAMITTDKDPGPGNKNADGSVSERIHPGTIEYLKPGEDVSFATPPPTEGYDSYARKILQGVAAGYDVTYELITNDLSNVNFSSGRMGWIEFGRMISQWQNQLIIEKFCKGVWKWFLEGTYLTGALPMDIEATWTPPTRQMIDPLKEAKGIVELVRSGLKSWQDAVREQGRDPDVVLKELGVDAKAFDELGLKLTSDARYDPNRPAEDDDFGDDPDGSKKVK